MSIALQQKISELERRVQSLESAEPKESLSAEIERLSGEIKAIKMRMGKNDGKRTP